MAARCFQQGVFVKITIPLFALALLMAAGCQQTKTADAQPSAIDVTNPTPLAAQPQPTPVAMPVADTSTPTINATITTGGNSYTVKPGDTLWKIAASHYGDGKKWKEIVDANPGLQPSKLRIGMTINLPG